MDQAHAAIGGFDVATKAQKWGKKYEDRELNKAM